MPNRATPPGGPQVGPTGNQLLQGSTIEEFREQSVSGKNDVITHGGKIALQPSKQRNLKSAFGGLANATRQVARRQAAKQRLCAKAVELCRCRQEADKFDQYVVEQRRSRFKPMRHSRDVHFHQMIVRKNGFKVGEQHFLQWGDAGPSLQAWSCQSRGSLYFRVPIEPALVLTSDQGG